MTEEQSRILSETNRAVNSLTAVVVGYNGDKGLVGTVEKMADGVAALQRTVLTLVTRQECVENRESCAGRRGHSADRKWMRTKDAILVFLTLVSVATAVVLAFQRIAKVP
jgi:hypothetical protein